MTDILCPNCDHEAFNDKDELNHYLATFQKKHDRGLYYHYTINDDVNLDNINKIFDYYINIHNEKYEKCFISCLIQIKFYNNTIANLENNNCYNSGYINLENYLSIYLKSCKSG